MICFVGADVQYARHGTFKSVLGIGAAGLFFVRRELRSWSGGNTDVTPSSAYRDHNMIQLQVEMFPPSNDRFIYPCVRLFGLFSRAGQHQSGRPVGNGECLTEGFRVANRVWRVHVSGDPASRGGRRRRKRVLERSNARPLGVREPSAWGTGELVPPEDCCTARNISHTTLCVLWAEFSTSLPCTCTERGVVTDSDSTTPCT